MRVVVAFIMSAAVVVAGRADAQSKREPVLDRLAVEFEAAFNARDASKIASMYADDAVLMPPDRPMIRGRGNIEAYYAQQFRGMFSDMRVLPFESVIAGPVAYEAGLSTLVVPGPDGRPRTPVGKYVIIYRRVGQAWKIVYDVFSDDEPDPGK
jgi:uncharacterized protein (TIGR02246 family)